MKNKVLKILTVFILFTVILGQFNFLSVFAAESSLHFVYQSEAKAPFKNTNYNYNTYFRRATLGDMAAYCIDYGRSLPSRDTTLTYQGKMSAEALAVLVYGYPNKDLEEFGLSSQKDYDTQYLVTQMAFWEVVTRTGENTHGLAFSLDDIVANPGYEDIMDEMKSAAKKLADTAMSAPYNPNPRIALDTSNYTIEETGDLVIAGPYKVTGYDGGNTTDFTLKNIKASLSNQPSSAVITDQNGNAKTEFSLNEPIYVVAKKSDTSANFNLNVEATGDLLSCGIYGGTDSNIQNFATIIKEPVTVSESVNITWKKDTGNITIVKEDQANQKIKDVRFQISDSSGQKIAEAVTNSSGRIDLLNIPTGKYTITEISAPKGYVMDTAPRTLIVAAGETVTTTYSNTKVAGRLEIVKKDENNDPIENVTFSILDSNKKVVQTIKTNSKGVATSEPLEMGTYYFVETDVPDNVIMDATLRRFEITSYNQVVSKTLENELVKGSLKITKRDENGDLLSGVKFDILDSNKNKIDTITTNNSGIAVSDELEPGTYYYKEVSTKDSNLIIDETEHEFKVTEQNTVIAREEVNYYKKGSLKILKVDQNNNPIEGVTFEIYDSNKNKIDTIVTNSKGIATTSMDLTLGTYYYKEVSAPNNIEMDPEEHKFTIKDEDQVIEVEVKNNLIQGKLKIVKTDENNQPISGATFEILDSNKQVIQTIKTDENGFAISDTLEKGTYYYREKDAPDIYVLDTTEHEFTISSDTDFIQETVINKLKSAKLIINKYDKDNSQPMKDIRFEILDSNNNIIASIVTDENGRAESDNLSVGTYYYREVSAPDNYVLDSTAYEFKIENENVNVEKTVYNVPKKLPVTGSLFSTDVIIVIVISLSCILVYIITKMIIAYIQNRNNNW